MRILLPTLAALGALGASLAPTLPASPTSQTTILPEVVVEPKKRQVLHITGYMREYSTLTTYGDTLLLFREKTVDFMVPTRRAKGYEGWLRPRVLASRSYYHFTDAAGLDSVSDRYQRHISWSDWLEIFDRVPLPDALRHPVSATDTLRGRYSPAVTWARDDDDVSIAVDVLAAPAASPWTPALHSIFKDRVEFYRFKVNYYLTGVDDYEAQADNIALVTFDVETGGRGWDVMNQFRRDEAFIINTYSELYVTGTEYLTKREAARLEKTPPAAEDVGIHAPHAAPDLEPEILALMLRVDNFDWTAHRLADKADPRYAGKKIPETFQKRPNILKRAIRSIIKDNVWPKEGMQGKFILGR